VIALLYNALHSPFGVVFQTDDIERAKARFYSTRAKLGDPKLDCLSLVTSPTDSTQLWIVKKGKEDETA